MGLFGASSIYDVDVEKATSENNTSEKWDLIMEICDKVGNSSNNAKECLRSIIRRLNHTDPHVVVQAITLLDACVSNCGKSFHLEVASRDFETEFKKIFTKTNSFEISTKLKVCLKRWAENEFKSDPQLNLIPSMYQKMKSEGHDFSEHSKPIKRDIILSKDPNVVSSQQEEEDIAKAIELSLKEVKINVSPKNSITSKVTPIATTASSLYPSMDLNSGSVNNTIPEPRKVRALYDFEAAEDNELTFIAGEVLLVLDDSDPNWWKGSNTRGEGLFPANFVTADLSAEPESSKVVSETKKKVVQYEDQPKEEPLQINEDTIDRVLHLLHEADPEDPSQDSDDLLRLENMVNQMGPLIDTELDRVDRKHGQLSQLSADFAEAVTLYHSLMRDDRFNMHMSASMQPYTPHSSVYPQHPSFNGQYATGPSNYMQAQQNGPLQNFTPNNLSNHPNGLIGTQQYNHHTAPPHSFIQNYSGTQAFIASQPSQVNPQTHNNFVNQTIHQIPPSQSNPQYLNSIQPGFSHQSPNHQPPQQFQQMLPQASPGQLSSQLQQVPQTSNIPLYPR